ncbi:ABC transporter permease [Marispirochaeta aestuarii]|uniref:ABC transporter permease n=1 Tax=Marispirochaeta aestuarii TaxID=1963862 RepID=UPI0029C8428A|nr:ABC transporter permease [Marispirochaeta aestuarii]
MENKLGEKRMSLRRKGRARDVLMPLMSILIVFVPILVLRPRVINYTGFNLLFNMAIPVALATIAQMFAMTISEIDLSIGNLVSLVTCIAGSLLPTRPLLGILLLFGIIAVYMLVGAVLYLRNLQSIVVTIGMSFIWTGLAIMIQPHPGGNVPEFMVGAMNMKTPVVPMPIFFLVILAILLHVLLFKSSFGILLRGMGGNRKAIEQSGHSMLKLQMAVFGMVGLFGILSGFALAGITTSADPNIARNYTLIAVASVVLGGGSFAGGTVSAVGVVLGACTMTLVGTLLTFLRISPDWQIGAQGIIILAVLFINSQLKKSGKVRYV